MKIYYRYLLGEVSLYGGVGLLLFTFVIFMRDAGRLLELAVGANSAGILAVFLFALPTALIFTIPVALLVGLLIGLGRLGVDQELTALRAAGLSSRALAAPLLPLVVGVTGAALLMTLWGAPAAGRAVRGIEARYLNAEIYSQVQPRVFIESLPGLVVYIGDTSAGGRRWRQVLLADIHDPVQPALTTAAQGELVAPGGDAAGLQLHLEDAHSYQITPERPSASMVSSFQSTDLPLQPPNPSIGAPTLTELSLSALSARARSGPDAHLAQVELERRWALAFACLALALVGLPLGLRLGRGGKSGGFVVALVLVFLYYLVFIFGLGMAREGSLPPAVGAWAANILFLGLGAVLWWRADRLPREAGSLFEPFARLRALRSRGSRARTGTSAGWSANWLPSLIDGYIMRAFLGYSALLLVGFLVLVLVFTLFELIGDILRTHASAGTVLAYLMYLAPQMLYLMIPVAILVAVLVSFGLMSKANEITALKASGVSVYRLIVPVLFVAVALGALQFALDATWLPGFNRKQDALRADIKGGQPVQTYQTPERKWVFGQNGEIYYYRFFDPGRRSFADISVFRLDPATFQLTRRIFAHEARWDDAIQGWVFENGWQQDFSSSGQLTRFLPFRVAGFSDLVETPAYFGTDSRQGSQMSYWELRSYIAGLQRSGYDVARLSVELARKLAYPMITVIMALLAFPFALTVGRRGAVAGVSIAVAVAITYWICDGLLEALGNLNQLPPLLAAWAPDLIFLAAGVYLLLRVPT